MSYVCKHSAAPAHAPMRAYRHTRRRLIEWGKGKEKEKTRAHRAPRHIYI